jgi:Uncharacterized conserved protein
MTVKLVVEHFIKPEKRQEALDIYEKMVAGTRAEHGCLMYDLHEDEEQPGHFIYIEEWSDQVSVDLHTNGEVFKTYFPKLMALSSTGTDRVIRIKKLL